MRNRRIFIAEALVEYMIALSVQGVFLVALLKQIGMSDAMTGILSSLISLGCMAQLFSSLSVKKGVSIQKSIIRITIGCDVLFGAIYFLPFVPFKGAAIGLCCAVMILTAYVLLYITVPVKYRWFINFLPMDTLGSFTAKNEIISLTGGMIYTFALGRLFDVCSAINPNGGCLLCGCLILFLTLVQILLLRGADDAPQDMQSETHGAPLKECAALFKESKSLRRLLVMDVLWNAATYISTPYFAAYLIGDLSFTVTQVSLFSVMYSVVRAAVSFPIGRFADLHGYRKEVTLGFTVVTVAFFVNCFTMPQTKLLYLVYYALFAISHAAIEGGIVNISFDYIPQRNYSTAAGIRKAVGGTVGFLVSLLGGKIVSAMQSGSMKIALFPYPQQLLSCISLVLCVVIILYSKLSLSRLSRVKQ